jgi:predicted CXXCH cytochrome family protein
MKRQVYAAFLAILFLSFSIYAAEPQFVGSDKCMPCHKATYQTWKESTHNRAVQEVTPSRDGIVPEWKGIIKLKSGKLPEATIKLDRGPDKSYRVTLVDSGDSSKEAIYKVAFSQGAGSMKGQNYYAKIGNNFYALPINWQTAAGKFVPTLLETWYNEDGSLRQPAMDKSWEVTCAGCHQTGLQYKKVEGGFEASHSEISIGCEKCHGPGSEHVKSPQAKGKIINPRNLDYVLGMDVCSQCHATNGNSVPKGIIRGAWNETKNKGYAVGEPLTDYMQFGGGPMPQPQIQPVVSNSSRPNTYHSISDSKHYEAKTACFDCHNPHGGPTTANLKRGDMDNSLCLNCHGKDAKFASPAIIMQHTKHSYDPDMKGTSRCTYCHTIQSRRMRPDSSGSGGGMMMPRVMLGFLAVSKPQQSLDLFKSNPKNVPGNSCNKCHKEWSGDEAGLQKGVAAYNSKFGK